MGCIWFCVSSDQALYAGAPRQVLSVEVSSNDNSFMICMRSYTYIYTHTHTCKDTHTHTRNYMYIHIHMPILRRIGSGSVRNYEHPGTNTLWLTEPWDLYPCGERGASRTFSPKQSRTLVSWVPQLPPLHHPPFRFPLGWLQQSCN